MQHAIAVNLRRRDFVTLLGGAAAAWPLAARAQQDRLPLVGVLRPNPKDITETFAQPFRRYMKAAGWEEGRNIRFLFVWAEGRSERIRQILDDSRGKITGIVTSSSRLITQIRKAGGSCRRL